jgi:amidase
MDVPDVKPGNTIYLPVWNEGALFYTGDCHARQGELCGVALEITSKVTVVFEVIKDNSAALPASQTPEIGYSPEAEIRPKSPPSPIDQGQAH